MNDHERLLHASVGLGPSLSLMRGGRLQPSPPGPRAPVDQALMPPILTSSETARRARMQQALPSSQSSVGSDYRWATLNEAASIGGHTFQAGTRIAVAPSQTQTSGGGKAHTTSIVTKVWAKFGQTFDSSSWVTGWLSSSMFSYTGQSATWSNATGFGMLTDMDEATIVRKQAGLGARAVGTGAVSLGALSVVGTIAYVGGGIGGGLLGAYLSSKHKVGATITGTMLGAFVVPLVVGGIVGAVAGGIEKPQENV